MVEPESREEYNYINNLLRLTMQYPNVWYLGMLQHQGLFHCPPHQNSSFPRQITETRILLFQTRCKMQKRSISPFSTFVTKGSCPMPEGRNATWRGQEESQQAGFAELPPQSVILRSDPFVQSHFSTDIHSSSSLSKKQAVFSGSLSLHFSKLSSQIKF